MFSYTFQGKTQVMGYVHKIYGYRYNWHNDMYEIDIVLKGTLEFFRDGTKHILHTDDMIVVNPGVGHASYPLEPDTQALVLRLSSRALNDFTSRKHLREFSFASNEENRNSQSCRLLRYYAAQIVRALRNGCTKPANRNLARSCLGMIAFLMATEFPSQVVARTSPQEEDPDRHAMADVTGFIEENYAEKLTLQDIADRFHYNRTYLSTLFKQTMGIGFHEYLTRVRFQKATLDFGAPGKNLSQIALDNGFPDLKSFNQLFYENFKVTPKEYRARLRKELAEHHLIPDPNRIHTFLDPDEPELYQRMEQYLIL